VQAPPKRRQQVSRAPDDEQDALPKLFDTAEVVARSGVSRQALNQYATLGLIEVAERNAAGHRLFDEKVFLRLRIIRVFKESGYSLKAIKEIFFDGPNARRTKQSS
jgi:DNA-binding transcriptional MerR regulator